MRPTKRNALTDANQDTTEDKNSNFVLWRKSLNERGNDSNEAADPHARSSPKCISLYNFSFLRTAIRDLTYNGAT